jgi:hypothetical protein
LHPHRCRRRFRSTTTVSTPWSRWIERLRGDAAGAGRQPAADGRARPAGCDCAAERRDPAGVPLRRQRVWCRFVHREGRWHDEGPRFPDPDDSAQLAALDRPHSDRPRRVHDDADLRVQVPSRGIVYTSSATGSGDIYTLPADAVPTTVPTRLTATSFPEADPVWSPDSRRIAFASNRDGTWRIYVMDADGTDVSQLPKGTGDASEPAAGVCGRARREGVADWRAHRHVRPGRTRQPRPCARPQAAPQAARDRVALREGA